MVLIGASVGCGPVPSTVVYTAVQANLARNAFRGAPTIPLQMTIVKTKLLWNSSFVSKARNKQEKIGRSHCSGAQLVVGSHSRPAFRALKQVGAREGKCRRIATGWVLERSNTTCVSLVKKACRAQILSTILPTTKANTRGSRQSARVTPIGISEMGSSSEAAVRWKKTIWQCRLNFWVIDLQVKNTTPLSEEGREKD